VAIELVAPAKLNLTLEVLGQRPDGYHEIVSLMQTIGVADRVRLEPSRTIELEVEGKEVAGVPREGPENLAYKAALVLHESARSSRGVKITIEKRIPVGMGLGGGSTDAAAVLRGLNRLWSLDMSEDALCALGAEISSDVPFFVHGGTAVARGRGELVEPIMDYHDHAITLFISSVELPNKTRFMYSLLSPASFTDGHYTRVAETTVRRALPLVETDVFNAFDRYVGLAAPEIDRAMNICREMGVPVWTCGSGPGFFAMQARADLPPLLEREMAAHGIRLLETRLLRREEALSSSEG
jgi:4-diphosphocytidyl-2-C-methyl-D-erythritol kinase